MEHRLLGRYVTADGNDAFDGRFLEPNAFENGVARVSDPEGRAYLIDKRGAPVIGERYDAIDAFVHGIANVCVDGKHGAITSSGKVIVAPTLTEALFLPAEGRITIVRDGRSGFLDLEGNEVVPPTWEAAGWLSDGLAVFFDDGAYGYVDANGNVVIEPRFARATAFSNGRAKVKVDELWGIIDRTGKLVHEAKYTQLGDLANGACWAVDENDKVTVLGPDGQLGKRAFDEVKHAGDSGYWPVRVDDKWGYLAPDGKLGKLELEDAWMFTDGLAPVQLDGKQGFIREDGTIAIPCRYDDVWMFANDRAAAKRDGGWTFVDPTGAEHGAPDLVAPGQFNEGVARVRTKSGYALQRTDGTRTELPAVAWVGKFSDGVAPVIAPEREGALVPTPPHVRPTGGLDHPVFAAMGASDHVITIVSFSRALSGNERARLDKRIASWERVLDPGGKLYTEDKFVGSTSVYLRVQNLANPKRDLVLLLDQLADLPLQELLFARWGTPPDTEVMAPRNNPAMRDVMIRVVFDTWDDYWENVWDRDLPRPVSENYFYLRGCAFENGDLVALEERHMPIWYPDVDVCLGVLGTQTDYSPPDDRAKEIESAIEAALANHFGVAGVRPPGLITRDRSPGIERVSYEGRSGYAFGIPYGDITHRFSAARVRYREQEVIDALRDVVKEKGLAPVILWHRFSNSVPMSPLGVPMVVAFNLFEPGVSATKPAAKKPAKRAAKKAATKAATKSAPKKSAATKSAPKKSAPKKSAPKKVATKAAKKSAAKKSTPKKSTPKKNPRQRSPR
jgi:hypothetical protein